MDGGLWKSLYQLGFYISFYSLFIFVFILVPWPNVFGTWDQCLTMFLL